jgi:hypothetical protein
MNGEQPTDLSGQRRPPRQLVVLKCVKTRDDHVVTCHR